MIVIVLSACPPGLRGYLTRWLMEISAGVFVGHTSRRVRELMWEKCVSMLRQGRAIMVYSARNEQHLDYKVHGHHWKPMDFEGITLMLRPSESDGADDTGGLSGSSTGWSKAAKYHKYGRRTH